jgi:3',5'-cyclic AMP phosphodiesterase CpdA
MKIAIISDIHIGPEGYHKGIKRKLSSYSEEFIQSFVQWVNTEIQPHFVVQLGDMIEDANLSDDLVNFQRGIEAFKNLNRPVHHLIGNHDNRNLSDEKLRELLGLDHLYYSFDAGDHHFVMLHSKAPVRGGQSFIPDEELFWLQDDLNRTAKATLIFVHHSLADQDLTGNPWFEGLPEKCLVQNRREVRTILERSGKVIAVINGHLHWNRVDIHGRIPYITIQSLVENFNNDDIPAGAYAVLELDEKLLKIDVFGHDSMSFSYGLSKPKVGL